MVASHGCVVVFDLDLSLAEVLCDSSVQPVLIRVRPHFSGKSPCVSVVASHGCVFASDFDLSLAEESSSNCDSSDHHLASGEVF